PPADPGGRLRGARFPPPSSGRPVPASAPSTWRSILPRDPLRDLRVADLHAELVALSIGEHHETAAALPPEVGDLRRAEPDQPLHLGVAASLPRPQVEVDPVLHRLALRHLEEEQLGAAAGDHDQRLVTSGGVVGVDAPVQDPGPEGRERVRVGAVEGDRPDDRWQGSSQEAGAGREIRFLWAFRGMLPSGARSGIRFSRRCAAPSPAPDPPEPHSMAKKQLTYADALKILGKDDSTVLDFAEKLVDGGLGAVGVPDLFGLRGEMVKKSRRALVSLREKVAGTSRMDRMDRIEAALKIIAVEALFTAIAELLEEQGAPLSLDDLEMTGEEQLLLLDKVGDRLQGNVLGLPRGRRSGDRRQELSRRPFFRSTV